MKIGTLEVGAGSPCRVVAEISNNHNGSLERAVRLLDAAKESGADCAKLQAFSVDELCALRGEGPAPAPWEHLSVRELYSRAQTPFDWFPKLYAHAASIGLPIFASVFGEESLAVLQSVNNPCYKVARLDNQNPALFEAVEAMGRKGVPLIVSEVVSGESGYRSGRISADVLRLYCPPGYPQTRFALGGRFTESMRDSFLERPEFDGFSYHGTSIEPPVVAATLGASLVECHFMLADEPSELEANVSLTEVQFAEMVRRVREVETMLA